jgi:hypothetical protein
VTGPFQQRSQLLPTPGAMPRTVHQSKSRHAQTLAQRTRTNTRFGT